jgi:hypothetical protein
MFTREHFNRVAQLLRDAQLASSNDDIEIRAEVVGDLTAAFADLFAESNPHFDRVRFATACAGYDHDYDWVRGPEPHLDRG